MRDRASIHRRTHDRKTNAKGRKTAPGAQRLFIDHIRSGGARRVVATTLIGLIRFSSAIQRQAPTGKAAGTAKLVIAAALGLWQGAPVSGQTG